MNYNSATVLLLNVYVEAGREIEKFFIMLKREGIYPGSVIAYKDMLKGQTGLAFHVGF